MVKTNRFFFYNRIKQKNEFKQIFEKSFRIYGNFFICRVMTSEDSYSKLGIIISKKFGNAVYRNYVKRIIREEFRKIEFIIPVKIIISQSKKNTNMVKFRVRVRELLSKLSDKYLLKRCILSKTIALKEMYLSRKMSKISIYTFYIISLYKKYISVKLANSCRFIPSCSIYALDALRMHTFLQASILIIKRITFCRPGGRSGLEPVPLIFQWKDIFIDVKRK